MLGNKALFQNSQKQSISSGPPLGQLPILFTRCSPLSPFDGQGSRYGVSLSVGSLQSRFSGRVAWRILAGGGSVVLVPCASQAASSGLRQLQSNARERCFVFVIVCCRFCCVCVVFSNHFQLLWTTISRLHLFFQILL
jgi:hypothetical protein